MRRACQSLWCILVLGFAYGTLCNAADKPFLVLDAEGHTAHVRKVFFTPDSKQLVSVSWDKTIRIWDVQTGETLKVLRPPIGPGQEGMLYAAALAPSGKTIAVGGYGFESGQYWIYMISLNTGQMEKVLRGHDRAVLGLAYSPDGKHLISSAFDNTARIWNVSSGRCEQILRGHSREIYGVTFSPDGRYCATSSQDKTAVIWNAATGERIATLRGHTADIHGLAWRPDGKVLATASDDGTIRQWGPTGMSYRGFNQLGSHGISSVKFRGNSEQLLYTQSYGPSKPYLAGMIELTTGKELVRFDEHQSGIAFGNLSGDGELAATCDFVGEIFVWRTSDASRVQKLAGPGRVPWSAAWSVDGTKIAWGHKNDGDDAAEGFTSTLERTFELSTLESADAVDTNFVYRQVELEGLEVVGGPRSPGSSGMASVSVRDGNRTLATIRMSDPNEAIFCYSLLPGNRVAVGTSYRLLLYNAKTGALLRDLLGHTGAVFAMAPSPDGRYFLTASGDMTLRIWNLDEAEPLLSCFLTEDRWIAWTPKGYYAASPGGEQLMGWHVNNGFDQMASFYPAAQFRASLYRPDVIKLLLKTGSVKRALDLADQERGQIRQPAVADDLLPPKVEIKEPVSGQAVRESVIEVRAIANSAEGNPVTALRLLLDGRPYQGQKGLQAVANPTAVQAQATWKIELEPGKHKLKVLADTAVSQGVSEEVEVIYSGSDLEAVQLPKLYVVAIGVTEYPGALKLNYAAKDANALRDALKLHSKSLFRGIEIQTITDAAATRTGVMKGLSWLRSQMTQNDYGIFFFAGHGDLDNDGALYFLPVDADPRDLIASAVPADHVKRVLSGIPGKLITIFDACHSAGIAGSETEKRRSGKAPLTDDLIRDLVTDESGVIAMCSSTGREFSLENNEFRQGSFTLAIVEGLSGKADFNKDGVVYLNELDTYVTDRVKELTRGQQHPVTAKPGSIRSFPLAKP